MKSLGPLTVPVDEVNFSKATTDNNLILIRFDNNVMSSWNLNMSDSAFSDELYCGQSNYDNLKHAKVLFMILSRYTSE